MNFQELNSSKKFLVYFLNNHNFIFKRLHILKKIFDQSDSNDRYSNDFICLIKIIGYTFQAFGPFFLFLKGVP